MRASRSSARESIASLLGAIRLGRLVADARVCTETQSMTGNDKTSRATRLAPDEGDDDAAISDDGLRPPGREAVFSVAFSSWASNQGLEQPHLRSLFRSKSFARILCDGAFASWLWGASCPCPLAGHPRRPPRNHAEPEVASMQRALLATLMCFVAVSHGSLQTRSASDGPWSGWVRCELSAQLNEQGRSYLNQQTHTWELTASTPTSGTDIKEYPATWTDVGGGTGSARARQL